MHAAERSAGFVVLGREVQGFASAESGEGVGDASLRSTAKGHGVSFCLDMSSAGSASLPPMCPCPAGFRFAMPSGSLGLSPCHSDTTASKERGRSHFLPALPGRPWAPFCTQSHEDTDPTGLGTLWAGCEQREKRALTRFSL